VEPKILITGDYWHPDFSNLLNSRQFLTLIPIDQIEFSNQSFDLVVIAQSLPNQFTAEAIEKIQIVFPFSPIIALAGSWCEGEMRTGVPWPGVHRVYWHQWQGRLDAFVDQLQRTGVTDWHWPRTATQGDLVLRRDPPQNVLKSKRRAVGLSATNAIQYEMLNDSITSLGWRCGWIETSLDQLDRLDFDPVCIDTGAIDSELSSRIDWIKQQLPQSHLIVVASYPRLDKIHRLLDQGVAQVVSKPYSQDDLNYALLRCRPSSPHRVS